MKLYCNVTFATEDSSVVDGKPQKLLRCSRCQGCFYRSKEEQRQHWRVHKKVCKAPSNDETSRVRQLSMQDAAFELFELLKSRNFRAGSIWVLLLQRIQDLFLHTNDRSEWFNEQVMGDQKSGRGRILSCARELASTASNPDMEMLWAIPNFANFLLSVDLTSSHMTRKKLQGEALSNDELFPYDFNPQVHSDSSFVELIVLILLATILSRNPNMRKGNAVLSNFSYRKTATAKVAFERMVKLWTDPYMRASMLLTKHRKSSVRQEWMP